MKTNAYFSDQRLGERNAGVGDQRLGERNVGVGDTGVPLEPKSYF